MSKRKAVKMLKYTNYTPIKKKALPCSLLQELEAQEEERLEELLQAAKDLEEALLAAPSLDSYIAQIKQIIDQIEKDLEAFNG